MEEIPNALLSPAALSFDTTARDEIGSKETWPREDEDEDKIERGLGRRRRVGDEDDEEDIKEKGLCAGMRVGKDLI